MKKMKYEFPYDMVKQGERIVIAGAGAVGTSYIEQILCNGYCEIAGIIDQAYKEKREVAGIQIFPYAALADMQYEHIIIAATIKMQLVYWLI